MKPQFEYYLESAGIHCKYAKGKPYIEGGEFHEYDEILLFIDGTARFLSNGITHDLRPGDMMVIPKGQFHQLVVDNAEEYTRCVLGFIRDDEIRPLAESVMTEIAIITPPEPQIPSAFARLLEAMESKASDTDKLLFARATLIELLFERRYDQDPAQIRAAASTSPVQRALTYIDTHYAEPLTLESIAQALYISPSTLSHRFRKEQNMSVYRYLSKKRLFAVRQCVAGGYALTDAARMCGFNDYAGFFRMYKKYYGNAPSQSQIHNNPLPADAFLRGE